MLKTRWYWHNNCEYCSSYFFRTLSFSLWLIYDFCRYQRLFGNNWLGSWKVPDLNCAKGSVGCGLVRGMRIVDTRERKYRRNCSNCVTPQFSGRWWIFRDSQHSTFCVSSSSSTKSYMVEHLFTVFLLFYLLPFKIHMQFSIS